MVLKSETDGHESFLDYWDYNQKVNNRDLVFTILPNTNSDYVAKLRTPSLNAGKIKPGQSVNVSLYDYPKYEFGVIRRAVSQISTTSTVEGTYIVDVSISIL